MGNDIVFSEQWVKRFRNVVNEDQELSWIGKFMDLRFMWQIGELQYLISVEKGKIQSIRSPTWNDSWDFSIYGPQSAWEKFIQPIPLPIYNDILGMITKLPECDLIGNRLAAMQNIRAFTRMMSLAREV